MVVRRRVDDALEDLHARREQSRLGGGLRRIEAQHKRGKLTARERIDLLFDEGTFEELDAFVLHRATEFGLGDQRTLGDAVVTGYGRVNGRLTFAFSQGLHRAGRLPVGSCQQEDLQGNGPRGQRWSANGWSHRLGRSAHPGRRAQSGRLMPTSFSEMCVHPASYRRFP